MNYEKLSKRALGCMYVATLIGSGVGIGIILAANFLLFIPEDIFTGKVVSGILIVILLINMIVGPHFRYQRYRYSINEECIDIREGILFVKREIVPIERLHKLSTEKGPIDRMFKVAKVIVTTAGGDVTIRFLEEEKAEKIAEGLKKRINQIVVEQRESDGKE